LIVSDIVAARDKLAAAGIEVSEFFHIGPGAHHDQHGPHGRNLRH